MIEGEGEGIDVGVRLRGVVGGYVWEGGFC